MSDKIAEDLKRAQAAAQQAASMVDGLVMGIQSLVDALGLDRSATRADMVAEISRLRDLERRARGDA